jgi:hypothetical protein
MTEVTELLNLWNETVEQCARRMIAGAQLCKADHEHLTPQEIAALGTARERARTHAEKIASMARQSVRADGELLPGQLDPEFYDRVAASLSDG